MRTHALVAAVAFGLGVVATLLVPGDPRQGGRAEPRAPAPPPDALARDARLREVEARNRELEQRVETLERERDAAEARAAGTGSAEGTAPAADGRTGRAPRFVIPAPGKEPLAVDWQITGEAMAKLMPLLSEAADVAHGRREMRAALWADIMQWFGPIVTEAIKLEQAGVPWSHPLFLANLVHATLREAGQPLDEAQEEALGAIADRYAEEDARRRAGYVETTPVLRQTIDEARIQDRFFAEVAPILRDPQRAVLYPPGVRGVVGLDVFSGATVWEEKLSHVKHKDRPALRAAAAAAHGKALELRPETLAHLEGAVGEWERALPDAFVFHEPDAAARAEVDMEPYARVMVAAERQLALHEALLLRAPLLDEERERILESEKVFVPLFVR